LDTIRFAALLFSLVLAAWIYRPAVIAFLVLTLQAFAEDQNRGQPWLYLYWMLLLFTLLPAPVSLAACRCGLSAAYVWSGIQKCNMKFFVIEPAWFVEPAAHWHLPSAIITALRWSIAAAPAVEIGIGIALWSTRTRWFAIGATILVHAVALLFLGPLGHNYDVIVWPWNLAMIALVLVLFGGKPEYVGFNAAVVQVRRSKPALILVGLFAVLPALSFFGWWDSYFSFALYSENLATANIFVTQAFADRLPPRLRAEIIPWPRYDPEHQGPFLFTYGLWSWQDLGVPFNSEPRNFHAMFTWLHRFSQEPGDLRMIVGQRFGPVIFYQGDERMFLQPQ
jgi:hypothetical protein